MIERWLEAQLPSPRTAPVFGRRNSVFTSHIIMLEDLAYGAPFGPPTDSKQRWNGPVVNFHIAQ